PPRRPSDLPFLHQPLRRLFHLAAAQAIDNAALALPRLKEGAQLPPCIVLPRDCVGDVRPVETRRENARLIKLQAMDQIAPRLRVRRRRQRKARNAGKLFLERCKLQIFRPKVMSPLADAMRLVNRDERQRNAREKLREAVARQPLRRDIEKIKTARREIIAHPPRLLRRKG